LGRNRAVPITCPISQLRRVLNLCSCYLPGHLLSLTQAIPHECYTLVISIFLLGLYLGSESRSANHLPDFSAASCTEPLLVLSTWPSLISQGILSRTRSGGEHSRDTITLVALASGEVFGRHIFGLLHFLSLTTLEPWSIGKILYICPFIGLLSCVLQLEHPLQLFGICSLLIPIGTSSATVSPVLRKVWGPLQILGTICYIVPLLLLLPCPPVQR